MHASPNAPHSNSIRRFGLYLAAASCLVCGAYFVSQLDIEITQMGKADGVPGDLRRIIQMSEIFAHGYGVFIAILGIWILTPERRRFLPRFAMLAILPGLVTQCIKMVVGRHRPGAYTTDLNQIENTWLGWFPDGRANLEYITQSFPSGHTATAVGLCIGLTVLFPRGRFFFAFLALLAASQRVVANAHWTSDVLAGAAVALVVCGIIQNQPGLNRWFARREFPATQQNQVSESESPDKPAITAA